MYVYKTRGTCSKAIEIELDGDTVKSVRFINGCKGNTAGVAKLAEGMKLVKSIVVRGKLVSLILKPKA